MFLERLYSKARRALFHTGLAGLTSLAILASSCVGSTPPPRKDLFSAIAKSASGGEMFEFSLWGRLVFDASSESADSRDTLAEFFAEGSSRPSKGYRMTLRKKPEVWPVSLSLYDFVLNKKTALHSESEDSWLYLEEIPGAVRAPGQSVWFSGRSGIMDPFGAVAGALPPLGSPDSVFERLGSVLSKLAEPKLSGQSEVRGHSVDVYTLSLMRDKVSTPKEVIERAEKAKESPSPSPSPAPSASGTSSASRSPSPSPYPTSLDGNKKLSLREAIWWLVYGTNSGSELPPLQQAEASYSLIARVYVDQIDTRIRRVEVSLGISSAIGTFRVDASGDFWGFDPIGEFKIPVDTTFISPENQEAIKTAGFEVMLPWTAPAGLELTGFVRRPDASHCEPLSVSYTGRGREGHLRLTEVPSGCDPALPPPPAILQSEGGPSPQVFDPALFSLTDTSFGYSVYVRREADSVIAVRKMLQLWVAARGDLGVSMQEVFEVLDKLVPLRVPIPAELALPLPREGPERR